MMGTPGARSLLPLSCCLYLAIVILLLFSGCYSVCGHAGFHFPRILFRAIRFDLAQNLPQR